MTEQELIDLLTPLVRYADGRPGSATVSRYVTHWHQMQAVAKKLDCNCTFDQTTGIYEVTPWDIFPEKLREFQTVVYDARTNQTTVF